MPFGRRPNQSERTAAKAAAQVDPNAPERGVVSLRRDMAQLAKMTAQQLARMRRTHDSIGAGELETVLGTPDYDDFVSDFNTLRDAVLQACPELADTMPDSL